MSGLLIAFILLMSLLFIGALTCEAFLYDGEQQLKS